MPSPNKTKSCGRGKHLKYHESTADFLIRKLLVKDEQFNHNEAYNILTTLKNRKTISHCKLICQPDGIRLKRTSTFGTSPYRKFYAYRDIERYYSFVDDQSILILGCNDKEQNARYYDLFKLPPNNLQQICDLISKARSNTDYVLGDDDTIAQPICSSQSTLTGANDLSCTQLDEVEDRHDVNEIPDPISQQINIQENENSCLYETDVVMPKIEPVLLAQEAQPPLLAPNLNHEFNNLNNDIDNNNIIDNDKRISNPTVDENEFAKLREDPIFAKLTQYLKASELLAIDLKYIESDPKVGNRMSSTGGMYMFVAHHKNNNYSEQPNTTQLPLETISKADSHFSMAYV